MFRDRNQAADRLVDFLGEEDLGFDRVISNTFTGYEVAEKVSERIGAPISSLFCAELSKGVDGPVYGAVCQDGTLWLNDAMVKQFMIDPEFIRESANSKRQKLEERAAQAEIATERDLCNQDLLIVNDGVSSGMKEAAVAGACIKQGPGKIAIAAPFISSTAYQKLSGLYDEIFCLERPSFVVSVNDGYWASDIDRF